MRHWHSVKNTSAMVCPFYKEEYNDVCRACELPYMSSSAEMDNCCSKMDFRICPMCQCNASSAAIQCSRN